MKAALLLVLCMSALALASPAFNKHDNLIDAQNKNVHQQSSSQYQLQASDYKQTQATEILKQWCYSSQMSQPELTVSFKKLVSAIKSQPEDQTTEMAVMSERICQGAQQQKSGETYGKGQADAQAHELVKDVYMDALIACDKRECTQQLVKIINSNKVDTVRASYYMTRIAVTEKDEIKDPSEIKILADSFCHDNQQPASDAIERQKLFAVTSLIGKWLEAKPHSNELQQTAEQVAQTIVERYIKPVSQQEVEQYQQQQPQQQSQQLIKRIAKRSAALKALANIPGWMLKEISGVQESVAKIADDKQELPSARQSAIECLEQNEQATEQLKKLAFDQENPIAVRVAAYRAMMTTVYAGMKDESQKQQQASQLIELVVKHCEEQRNQQQDEQFVLYAVSHLDNLRTSQQPEYLAIKETIAKNKQHFMQIQLLAKKMKHQLNDIRKSSRNYKLEQEFNQLESGLVLEGDIVYESPKSQYAQRSGKQHEQFVLPKLVRVNMSMPVMGETVNVVEVTLRQDAMDEELLSALKIVQGAKFSSQSVSKIVDSFKWSVENQRQQNYNTNTNNANTNTNNNYNSNNKQQGTVDADLTIKVDGCTIVYLSVDDFKTEASSSSYSRNQRNTRSIYSKSIVDDIIEYLKRKPVAFNRGFNFNLNQRLAKVLDVDANVIAGLRFASHAQGQSSKNFELVAHVEPRFGFEAVVGPAKMSAKKLLQRFSTKTALGFRLRFVEDELVDVQIELPMNTMELYTVESQIVEKSKTIPYSYTYLPESVYGEEDIYAPEEFYYAEEADYAPRAALRKMKSSIFAVPSPLSFGKKQSGWQSIGKLLKGKSIAHEYKTSEKVARATGLRAKLRFVASPKDMSFVSSCIVSKYEPTMQGFRVQLQKVERAGQQQQQQQYLLKLSTPGSRTDRTMQVQLYTQADAQRVVVKSEVQWPNMGATVQYELVHDGRQYAVKLLAQSTRGKQWHHLFEAGIQRGNTARGVATAYKPYLNVESTYLRRPMQLQGVVSYQQSPKSVITYELKSAASGDFVQGKIILEERQTRAQMHKRSGSYRRSMSSPLELVLANDLTFGSEFVAQVQQHAVKVHKMLDWDSSKYALSADFAASHKNLRKSSEPSQVIVSMKVDQEQQVLNVERKSPQQQDKEFRVLVASKFAETTSLGHIMEIEVRKPQRASLLAYRHKLNVNQMSPKKLDITGKLELVNTERRFKEQLETRVRLGLERHQKSGQLELSTRGKVAKVNVEFYSLAQHLIELVFQGDQWSHKTLVRADQRQFAVQSRTDKRGQMLNKLVAELAKQTGEFQFVFELPTERTHLAADLKFASGKLSSVAVQTPRFASKGEFSFETLSSRAPFFRGNSLWSSMSSLPTANWRIKSDLKDLLNKQAYWLESAWNGLERDSAKPSYLRYSSPLYRSDIEYEPRERSARLGMFARSKRSIGDYEQLYSTKDSILNNYDDLKNQLDNKMWLLRTIISSPSAMQGLKQKARQALFQYADRRESLKHLIDWDPSEQRVKFDFERQPWTTNDSFKPMRLHGDFDTTTFYKTNNYWANNKQQYPSKFSLSSDMYDFDMEAKPYDGEESYAKFTALSRNRRSPFKQHESEYRYKKDQGYKAWMKHQDSKDQHHSMNIEADHSPKKWTKIAYNSDKHGKGEYEHQYRKHDQKRGKRDMEDMYNTRMTIKHQKPSTGITHESSLDLNAPGIFWGGIRSVAGGRYARDVSDYANQRRYNTIDYLKHIDARVNSITKKNEAELYKLDFDYQPTSHARFSLNMPDDMWHESSFEYEPTKRFYKLQSKLMNQRTQEPTYDFLASTKPIVAGLATADQEPVFFDDSHPMISGYPSAKRYSSLFKQPLKVDYSDKYGRLARFDYDHSPLVSGAHYAGLRQKRAAFYYKDDSADFEHESNYDFYPEAMLAKIAKYPGKRVPGDMAVKAMTKYGPVIVRADSDSKSVEFEIESPIGEAKIIVDQAAKGAHGAKFVKIQLDNKKQKVQIAKILRQSALFRKSELAQRIAHKLDSSRVMQEVEVLFYDNTKIALHTIVNERRVLLAEGEIDARQGKAFVKIDGERVKGRMVVDLASRSAELMLDVDGKRTVEHYSRISPIGAKFFALESHTSYEGKPVFKVNGKISSMVFTAPEHLFARRSYMSGDAESHISTFEAMIFEPKRMQVSAYYDCSRKEGRITFKNLDEGKIQETIMKYDEPMESILFESRLQHPYGQIYASKAKLSLPGLFQSHKCYQSRQSCQSELIYSDKSGNWMTKYIPGDYFQISTPYGKQALNLAY